MAKDNNKKPGNALATAGEAELAPLDPADESAALAELGAFFDDVGVDGLEGVGGEDIKLAVKLWNMKGLDKAGRSYPRDVFFDTVSETTADVVDCVLLLTQKTKRFDSFDNALDKTIVHCESQDRVTGTMKDGTRRPCNGCPDDGWFKDETGKTFRKCGEVHNVVGVERLTQKPFAMRFKKTALKPFRQYVMAHHWGARKAPGSKRANVPLFVYGCTLRLKMHESGKYAVPVFERGAMLPPPEVRSLADVAKGYLEHMGQILASADAQAEKHSTSERDENIGADDFVA